MDLFWAWTEKFQEIAHALEISGMMDHKNRSVRISITAHIKEMFRIHICLSRVCVSNPLVNLIDLSRGDGYITAIQEINGSRICWLLVHIGP